MPDGQQKAPVGPKQQLDPGAQQIVPVGDWHSRVISPWHSRHAWRQAACAGPLVKLVLPHNTEQLLGAPKAFGAAATVIPREPTTAPPMVPPMMPRACRRERPPATARDMSSKREEEEDDFLNAARKPIAVTPFALAAGNLSFQRICPDRTLARATCQVVLCKQRRAAAPV